MPQNNWTRISKPTSNMSSIPLVELLAKWSPSSSDRKLAREAHVWQPQVELPANRLLEVVNTATTTNSRGARSVDQLLKPLQQKSPLKITLLPLANKYFHTVTSYIDLKSEFSTSSSAICQMTTTIPMARRQCVKLMVDHSRAEPSTNHLLEIVNNTTTTRSWQGRSTNPKAPPQNSIENYHTP